MYRNSDVQAASVSNEWLSKTKLVCKDIRYRQNSQANCHVTKVPVETLHGHKPRRKVGGLQNSTQRSSMSKLRLLQFGANKRAREHAEEDRLRKEAEKAEAVRGAKAARKLQAQQRREEKAAAKAAAEESGARKAQKKRKAEVERQGQVVEHRRLTRKARKLAKRRKHKTEEQTKKRRRDKEANLALSLRLLLQGDDKTCFFFFPGTKVASVGICASMKSHAIISSSASRPSTVIMLHRIFSKGPVFYSACC